MAKQKTASIRLTRAELDAIILLVHFAKEVNPSTDTFLKQAAVSPLTWESIEAKLTLANMNMG